MKVSSTLTTLLAVTYYLCTLSLVRGENVYSHAETPLDTANGGVVPFFCKWLDKGKTTPSCPAGLASHCPDKCGSCSEYICADSEVDFMWNGSLVNCAWVQGLPKSRKRKVCSKNPMKRTCRATCNLCAVFEKSFAVEVKDKDSVPFIPEGLQLVSDTMPVLMYKDLSLWAFSFVDNRAAFEVVAFNGDGTMATSWYLQGARYLDNIIIDTGADQITFTGQDSASVSLGFEDVYCVEEEMSVQDVLKTSVPFIPDGLEVATLEQSEYIPVLKYNDLTFWAFSFSDNRMAFMIVAFDKKRNIVNQWELEGARYLDEIVIDYSNSNVIFYGQDEKNVKLSFGSFMG